VSSIWINFAQTLAFDGIVKSIRVRVYANLRHRDLRPGDTPFGGGLLRPNARPASPGPRRAFHLRGLSSCPPADALLRKLDGLRTEATPDDAGQLIVGISEHVTYWNQLGWSDPFSRQAYTDRQTAYGQRFHLESVYTPQVVVNGEREASGSDGVAILKAVRNHSGSSPITLHIDSATRHDAASDPIRLFSCKVCLTGCRWKCNVYLTFSKVCKTQAKPI
jgi:hypothetical protein